MNLFFYISTFGRHYNLLNAVFREQSLQTLYKNMINESKIIFKSQNVTKVPKWRFNTEIWIKWLIVFSPDSSSGQFCFLKSINWWFLLSVECWTEVLSPSCGPVRNYSPRRPVSMALLWRSCWLPGLRERGGISHKWTIVIITFIVTLLCFITDVFKDGTHCSKIRLVLSWEVTTFGQFYVLVTFSWVWEWINIHIFKEILLRFFYWTKASI